MSKRLFILPVGRNNAIQAIKEAPDGYAVTVGESTRNLEQNAAQWPILNAYADQLQISVNGQMTSLLPDEWKDILTGVFKEETQRVASYRGRVVLVGHRTSKFGRGEFSDWLNWLHAQAIEDGVEVYAETA